MAIDYDSIVEENKTRYGTDVNEYGQVLLSHLYAERTHFIFELLQNAEDALMKRGSEWLGRRDVEFELDHNLLKVSHFGVPFDETDVRNICGIAKSKKDLTAIGRFGIGFKSVYAITDRPEVHSVDEHFAIEDFVKPKAVLPLKEKDADETIFILPLNTKDTSTVEEIIEGLQRLGPRTLLFLHQIETICWNFHNNVSGLYLRSKPDYIDECTRKVTLMWQTGDVNEMEEETWLIFSRPVYNGDIRKVGDVEIAFLLDESGRIQPLNESPMVVFFPTVIETHLRFLIQGPYRTTPSRDNVPHSDPWNKHLIEQTATLLVNSLFKLKKMELLDVNALNVLPMDRSKFPDNSKFVLLFEKVRECLLDEKMLPRFQGGYVAARQAKLASANDLRKLISPRQLTEMLNLDEDVAWLSESITQDRYLELRQYLRQELHVSEVTPESIIPRLNKKFLEAQDDNWISNLYEFFNARPFLRWRLDAIPLVRLNDNSHVIAKDKSGQPKAFLPTEVETDFPTVKPSVCGTQTSREFLESLGLKTPDPVDDVIWNVLPKYRNSDFEPDKKEYSNDIKRILSAFNTDSKGQREKLVDLLKNTAFVKAVDSGHGHRKMSAPDEVYLPTKRLRELFEGIHGVMMVDDSFECLKGEEVRGFLEVSGVTRSLRRIPVQSDFSARELLEIRREAGWQKNTGLDTTEDFTLLGLEELLSALSKLKPELAAQKARLLWEALIELESRGHGAFIGSYQWYYMTRRSCQFDAKFVRLLNKTAWIPGSEGKLQIPEFVTFETLEWDNNPFLQSKIYFKPPAIEKLAEEAGIEYGVLDFLKKHGLTSVAEFRNKLNLEELEINDGEVMPSTPSEAVANSLGDGVTAPTSHPAGTTSETQGQTTGRQRGADGGNSRHHSEGGKRTPDSAGGRPFISYVATYPDEMESDPDGLDHGKRMSIERLAIDLIRKVEPEWIRAEKVNNPGFDLYQTDDNGNYVKWCEVKAMTGSLDDRPVGLSRTQFDFALENGESYWLYVVEYTGTEKARIVRIKDPAGNAQTFTFDKGWREIAEIDDD